MYNGLTGIEDMWWHHVIDYLGAELLVDAAYSGGRVSGTEFPAGNSYERIHALRTIQHEPDGILIYLGFNDYGYSVPIHNDEANYACFYNAYVMMLNRLKNCYPNARIICSTLMPTYITFRTDWKMPMVNGAGIHFNMYNDAIREACKKCGVELADIAATGICCDTLDGSHGTQKGQRELSEAWKRCLTSK